MCADYVRDGVTTTTIPDNPTLCTGQNCDNDTRYGMNENYTYYRNCKLRERNQGLFTADQQLNDSPRPTARFTRQNPTGTRRGYECPEERDYYPYWQPTPWMDIAVLTNNASRCPFYQAESQNVKSRWRCVVPDVALLVGATAGNVMIPNNEADCRAFRFPAGSANGLQAVWQEVPAFGLPPPDCRETQFSRDNHLGNGIGGNPLVYNWTVANWTISDKCVMRLRYNISTGEYDGWNSSVDASLNSPSANTPSQVNVGALQGLSATDAASRQYVLKKNPQVQVFPGAPAFKLALAVNTAQYGRTFQDRSFVFGVRTPPDSVSGAAIYNLNVRGKRGNIVQVYPAVEYDFVPNTLAMKVGDYVHIQWTGSDTNPDNNVGQGRTGTDRSNIVVLGGPAFPQATPPNGSVGQLSRNYPAQIAQASFIGFNMSDLKNLALLTNKQFGGVMSLLDEAGTYYDLGLRQVTQAGIYNYMSTRNNNFSNRDQKGRVIAASTAATSAVIGVNGGTLATAKSSVVVNVKPGALDALTAVVVNEIPISAASPQLAASLQAGDGFASNFFYIYTDAQTPPAMSVTMKVNASAAGTQLYYSASQSPASDADWQQMSANIGPAAATFTATANGYYVARQKSFGGGIAGIVIAVAVVIAAVIVGVLIWKGRTAKSA